MSIKTSYLFIATMDVDADKEDLFNELYDQEHIPNLLRVPGVISITRLRGEPFDLAIEGKRQEVPLDGPVYTTIYEIRHPEVLVSEAWSQAIEEGRWPEEVRPFTRNRQHRVLRAL